MKITHDPKRTWAGMEYIQRDHIAILENEFYREIIEKETHHEHKIIRRADGLLAWEQNPSIDYLFRLDLLDLNKVWIKCALTIGENIKNSESIRRLYRDLGYTLDGYWEIFYWDVNNELAEEYIPNNVP